MDRQAGDRKSAERTLNMTDDLQRRLRRLGVVKGARQLKPAPRPPRTPAPDPTAVALARLLPSGRLDSNEDGQTFVVDTVNPLSARHGSDQLADALALQHQVADLVSYGAVSAPLRLDRCLFLDTETTGLAGTGTLAFMVGVGYFDGAAFVVRQYFLRDPGDEPAMLTELAALAADKAALVTFNGHTFDIPLLQTRYLMNRRSGPLADLPHLDLLMPARRLWRYRLGSVALSALEENMLGVHRTQQDVPGWLIPSLYHDYLRSGDARELVRVFYHNQIDILSMVTLSGRLLRLMAQPEAWPHAEDVFGLARWQVQVGRLDSAESLLRHATRADQLPLPLWHQALHELGQLLKRQERRAEAIVPWQQIAYTSEGDVAAHVELAKYYEWHADDPAQALRWTEAALALLPPHQPIQRQELLHRLNRLQRKLDGSSTTRAT
jgi:uncharacterized protein YprB with RNaseH-like and TPR domain